MSSPRTKNRAGVASLLFSPGGHVDLICTEPGALVRPSRLLLLWSHCMHEDGGNKKKENKEKRQKTNSANGLAISGGLAAIIYTELLYLEKQKKK